MRTLTEDYLALFSTYQVQWAEQTPPAAAQEELRQAFQQALRAIFDATHNRLLQQLAPSLLHLHSLRNWQDAAHTGDIVASESAYLHTLVDVLAGRDADAARRTVRGLMQLPEYAVAAMRATPIGEIPVIVETESTMTQS